MAKPESLSLCGNRLLDAAIDQFGRMGRNGASTRAIAAAAGTTMSAITYHFGGKDGIYLAAAGHIADHLQRVLASSLDGAAMPGARDDEALLAEIDRLVAALLDLMLDERSADWARFVSREQLEPTEAFEILYDRLLERVGERLAALIAGLGHGRWDDSAIRVKAVAILGQVRIFGTAPGMVRRMTGLDPAKPEDKAAIEAHLLAVCRAAALA